MYLRFILSLATRDVGQSVRSELGDRHELNNTYLDITITKFQFSQI